MQAAERVEKRLRNSNLRFESAPPSRPLLYTPSVARLRSTRTRTQATHKQPARPFVRSKKATDSSERASLVVGGLKLAENPAETLLRAQNGCTWTEVTEADAARKEAM